jgi:hypothetical protein
MAILQEVAMPKKSLEAIEAHFSKVTDPRKDRTKEHKLIDIIAIAICAVICGAEGWTDIENFGKSKELWLRTFLELPNGIPSHDTFGRVFSMIDARVSTGILGMGLCGEQPHRGTSGQH